MKQLVVILCAALMGSGFAYGNSHSDVEEGVKEDLVKAKSKFKETWVKPDADFTKYNKIKYGEAGFQFRDVGPARRTSSTMRNSNKTIFAVLDADKLRFEEEVSKAFGKEMERSKTFSITEQSGSGTLILHGAVVDIISRVPPPTVGRRDLYLSTIAEGTWILELEDAETGHIVARVSERRKIQRNMGGIDETTMRANTVTIWAEVRRWAQRGAGKLRRELEKAQKG